MEKYLNSNQESGRIFYQKYHNKGKIVMLNLLKFKLKADYSNLGNIKPDKEISGIEAFQLYMNFILPELTKSGSRIIFYGESSNYLIGPEAETWDMVLLVEHESVSKFIEFSDSEEFLKNVGHRTAALEDSRLLPILEKKESK